MPTWMVRGVSNSEWLRVLAGQRSAPFLLDETAVRVHAQGSLQVAFNSGSDRLQTDMGAWDALSLPGGCVRQFVNAGDEDAQALLAVHNDARKTPRFDTAVHAAALGRDVTLDAGGRLARRGLLPPAMTR